MIPNGNTDRCVIVCLSYSNIVANVGTISLWSWVNHMATAHRHCQIF